jgi:hypothetical protein
MIVPMTDTPAPEGAQLPESPVSRRSRPADVVANPPVTKTPAAGVAPASPGAGIPATAPPADSPALATQRAARMTQVAADAVERGPLTTDQIMPTCMIYAMFALLAVLIAVILLWGLGAMSQYHLF